MIIETIKKAAHIKFDNTNSGLNAKNVQAAIEELGTKALEGVYFGFSCYQGNAVAGIFVPLESYIVNNYTISAADKIYFSGVSDYTVDEITVKNNGILVGHRFSTPQEALNSIKAVSSVNGTVRLTFTKK